MSAEAFPSNLPTPPENSVTEPNDPLGGSDAASSPLPWEHMSTDERFYALLMLINSLGKVSEIQNEAIGELQERLQTLEFEGEV